MLRLAGPVIMAELGWMAMGLVDVVMVGRLGPAAIGAIGIGKVVFIAVGIVGAGLLLGLDTSVSQAVGAGGSTAAGGRRSRGSSWRWGSRPS
jgi:MATE family multidrug resistance protein